MQSADARFYFGFNRPQSRFGRIIRESLRRERGPGMFNWFVAGHAIEPDHWYFRPEEGGRVLGNLCHWTDFLYQCVEEDRMPIRIQPTRVEKSDSDVVVTYTFGDGSIGAISFSAKGHAFEGVKERFSAHKGNCLITMDNFQTLTVEIADRKRCFRNRYRDHGHRDNIVAAYQNALKAEPYDRSGHIDYGAQTAHLFLKTKEALETERELSIGPYLAAKPE